jgi:hypothetical protein
MSVPDYITQISNSNPGYVANWPLNYPIVLGGIGSLNENGFNQFDKLDFQSQITESADLSQSKNVAIINEKPQPGLVTITFSDSNGFVLQATDVTFHAVANLMSAKDIILEKIKDEWNSDWYIVTGIQLASVATVIVSSSDSSAVELSGTLGLPPLLLAGNAKLEVNSSTGSTISYIASQYPVLMYRALKFKDWPLAFEFKTGSSLPPMEALTVEDVLRHYKW